MRRVCFRIQAEDPEAVLDGLLPLLPAGLHDQDGLLSSTAGTLPDRATLEAAAGIALADYREIEVPADWRERRALFGGGSVTIQGRVAIRSPWDPEPPEGVLDIVIERRGSAFGSGSHPTTQMCIALMLDLEPTGAGAADLGCGIGVLAIAAAKLGWDPVVAVDRMPVAIEVAAENIARNGVEVTAAVSDLAVDAIPLAPLLLVNAPPPVQERVAAALTPAVRHVIVSGIVAGEVDAVIARYAAAGFAPAEALGTEDEWLALRMEPAGG